VARHLINIESLYGFSADELGKLIYKKDTKEDIQFILEVAISGTYIFNKALTIEDAEYLSDVAYKKYLDRISIQDTNGLDESYLYSMYKENIPTTNGELYIKNLLRNVFAEIICNGMFDVIGTVLVGFEQVLNSQLSWNKTRVIHSGIFELSVEVIDNGQKSG
jgi:hypothetical protein